jgi:hypothetical protein
MFNSNPLFNNFTPFSEQSDRRSQVGMKTSDEWIEPKTGIRHFNKTHGLTGEKWSCIADHDRQLLAEQTIGRRFDRTIVIRRSNRDGHELSREVYGLGENGIKLASTPYSQFMAIIEDRFKKGKITLLSGSDEPKVNPDGSYMVRSWSYIWRALDGENARPLGKRYVQEEYSKEGVLLACTLGNKRTEFRDDHSVAIPQHSHDTATGQQLETMHARFLHSGEIRVVGNDPNTEAVFSNNGEWMSVTYGHENSGPQPGNWPSPTNRRSIKPDRPNNYGQNKRAAPLLTEADFTERTRKTGFWTRIMRRLLSR